MYKDNKWDIDLFTFPVPNRKGDMSIPSIVTLLGVEALVRLAIVGNRSMVAAS